MASANSTFETHGEENIPAHGCLVVPNRLEYRDLRYLEKFFKDRKLVFLMEKDMSYDALLHNFLIESTDTESMEFSASEQQMADEYKRALFRHIESDAVVVFVPGAAQTRRGQTVAVPAETLDFIIRSSGAPLLPMYVEHPEDSALSTENRQDIARIIFSFGRLLEKEAANLANFTENILIAGEKAYSARPILQGNLAYEIIKGLKKHGSTSRIIDGNDESELRYDKLLAAAITFSKQISKLTSKKRVGIILPPGKGGLLANLAVLFANKVPVNLNFTAGKAAIESCIEQADLDRFITGTLFVEKMDTFAWPSEEKLILLDQVLPPLKKQIGLNLLKCKLKSAHAIAKSLGIPKKSGDKEAILLFTSGSSGMPKGVVLSHRNLLANVNQFGSRISLHSNDSVLGCLPLFHSFGCTVTMWYPMIEGINLVTYPSPLDAGKLAELVEKYKVNLLLATPTFLRGYLRKATKEQLESVKLVITGAEKLPQKVADSFERRFGLKVYEGYGLTETSPVTNVNLPDEEDDTQEGVPVLTNHTPGSVGHFIPGVAVRITDPETFEPLSLHTSGMIWLRGSNIFEGYLHNEEKTNEVMVNGWFMTGDIGRLDENGFLYIEGRLSRFSKIGGEMVPHETVETAVNQALEFKDDERKIAIVGLPDEAKGEQLILLASEEVNMTYLRTQLKVNGIPALWTPKKIVEVDEIPMLASGKLDIKGCEEVAKANV